MDYFYSPITYNSKQSYFQYSKKLHLNKKNYSSNKNSYLKNENSYKKSFPNSRFIEKNYHTVKIIRPKKSSVNYSHKDIEEFDDDLLITNFYTHENTFNIEKKTLIRNNDKKLKNKICNLNNFKNKKISRPLKKLLVCEEPLIQKNNDNLTSSNFSENKSSNHYINIMNSNNKNNELINMNKTLFNNLTERNIKINNSIKENNLKSKINNYLSEEQQIKLKNDGYYAKYIELEKEYQTLKNSISDYQNENQELKNKINNLKKEADNDKEKPKENLLPIKVKIKENIRNSTNIKNNNLEQMIKENNKLLIENKIYKTQIDEYTKKIKELSLIIKNKDKYIKILKSNNIEDKNINKDKSKKIVKKKKSINKSVDKLLFENEENKKIINKIFEKINKLGNPEKEYNQYININVKETMPKNISPTNIKKNQFNYQIEKHEFKIQNISSININNYKDNLIIQRLELKIEKDDYKEEQFEYQIEKNQIKIIANNENYKNKNKFEIFSVNEIQISPKINEKDLLDKSDNEEKENLFKEKIKNIDKFIKRERNNRFLMIDENLKNEKNQYNDENSENILSSLLKDDFGQEKKEIKEEILEKEKKGNSTQKTKEKKKIKILDGIDITEINTSKPVRIHFSLSSITNINEINKNYLFLYGLYKDNSLLKFDLINKKWMKQIKILEVEDLSDTFKNNYIFKNTIIYNVLNGCLILTGEKMNILYYYNAINETITNLCEFNKEYQEGNILIDAENNRVFIFGEKKGEYYSFSDKKIYEIPELHFDRIKASFILYNNKIYCFFGYSKLNKKYNNTIEYIDIQKLDEWKIITEVNDFDNSYIEKLATATFKEEPDYIYLYCGIKNNEDKNKIINENIVKFNTKTNTIDKVTNINVTQYKFIGSKWRRCDVTNNKSEQIFIFENNTNFLNLPNISKIESSSHEIININRYVTKFEYNNAKVLIDADNNIHYFFYDSKNIEIFRSYYK